MVKNVKYFIEQSWLLIIASFAFGLLLAVTNAALAPKIKQNQIDKFNRLAGAMLGDEATFEALPQMVPVKLNKGKTVEVEIKKASIAGQTAGWAFVCQGSGFADKIKIVLTVDGNFEKIAGFGVLASNETPGFGDKIKENYYLSQFMGAPATELKLSSMAMTK